MRECDFLTEYLLGELGDIEAASFEAHLVDCRHCRTELQALLPIHAHLMEGVDDNQSAKWVAARRNRLLEAVFAARPPAQHDSALVTEHAGQGGSAQAKSVIPNTTSRQWLQRSLFPRTRATRVSLAAAAGLIMAVAITQFQPFGWHVRSSLFGPTITLALTPNHQFPNARGEGTIIQQSSHHTSLHLYVKNGPQQTQWGCYDVWGIKDDKHVSLGEFTVDAHGNGSLSVAVPAGQRYDSIVVTLEPQWDDVRPLGQTVFTGLWAT